MANKGHTGNLLLLGGGAVALYLLSKPMREGAQLVRYTQKLRVNMPAMRFKGDDIEFDVYIQNPNSYPITIKAIVGDVFLTTQNKKYKLGNVKRYGDTVIQPVNETKFVFRVRMRFLGLLPYFSDMVEGKIKNQVLSFTGTINVNGRPWPIKEQLRIS